MGQRHQIYIRYKHNSKLETIGFHHQWIWGYAACRQLARVIQFYEAAVAYANRDYMPMAQAFEAVYSVDIESGYYSKIHRLESCDYPENEDNNNGITVIDLTGERPRYAFASFVGLECLDASKENSYKNWTPISAHEYLTLHYPNYETPERPFDHQCQTIAGYLRNFETINIGQLNKIFPESSLNKKRVK